MTAGKCAPRMEGHDTTGTPVRCARSRAHRRRSGSASLPPMKPRAPARAPSLLRWPSASALVGVLGRVGTLALRERAPREQLEQVALGGAELTRCDRHRRHPGQRPRAGAQILVGSRRLWRRLYRFHEPGWFTDGANSARRAVDPGSVIPRGCRVVVRAPAHACKESPPDLPATGRGRGRFRGNCRAFAVVSPAFQR